MPATTLALRLIWAIPLAVMVLRLAAAGGGTGQLLQASGDWAARFLILTLAITPLRLLLKHVERSQPLSMALFKARRDVGLAALVYAALHVGTYAVRQGNLHVILFDLPYKEYLAGWTAFVTMLALGATSSGAAVHGLGRWWKRLQRLVYVSAIAAYLHWLWIRLDHTAAIVHFLPLVVLEAYRIWHNFARPAGHQH